MSPSAPTPRPARRIATRTRPGRQPMTVYSPDEDATLRRLFPTAPRLELLAALPGHTWRELQRAAERRGLKRPRRQHNTKWEGYPIALLRRDYARVGAGPIAAELGFTPSCVRAQAEALGLRYKPVRVPKPQAPRKRIARVPKVKTEKPPKPAKVAKVVVPKPAPVPKPEPVKRSPSTPLLNARHEERRREQAKIEKQSITQAIQKLAPNSEGRFLYMRVAATQGGPAATEAFRAWQAQQK